MITGIVANFLFQSAATAAVVALMVRVSFWQAGGQANQRRALGSLVLKASHPPLYCTRLAGWARIVSSWGTKTERSSEMISWKRSPQRVYTPSDRLF